MTCDICGDEAIRFYRVHRYRLRSLPSSCKPASLEAWTEHVSRCNHHFLVPEAGISGHAEITESMLLIETVLQS